MTLTDASFFDENIHNINKMVSKILMTMIFVPILFLGLSYLELFNITYTFSIISLIYCFIISMTVKLLIKLEKAPLFTMYLGLIGIQIFVSLEGINASIGIFLTYGIVPFISCLYYSRKHTNIICAISYIFMLISLYFKFQNEAPLFDIVGEKSFTKNYIPIIAGVTMEFLFILLVSNLVVIRNYKTLKMMINLLEDRNSFIEKLKDVNKKFEEKDFELQDAQEKIINFIARSLKTHDLLTGFHVEHTKTYVQLISRKMKDLGFYINELTEKNIKLYSDAAFIHDIGKIHTPEGVLNKPGKLTVEEFEMMKKHPKDGFDLISILPKIGNGSFNEIAKEIALYHHEKWDGTGYPNRIAGTNIPLCARIMTAADVLDALISLRTYKQPMPIEKAMRIFVESSGTQFEPCIVEAVLACKEEIKNIDSKFKEKELPMFYKEVEEKHKYNEILKQQTINDIIEQCEDEKLKAFLENYSNNG